jgi:ATP-dependent Clp protease protease subunit
MDAKYKRLTEQFRRSKVEDDSYCRLDKSLATIYIVGEITQKLASDFRQHIRTLERLKRVTNITVELNTPGGDIEAGLMIIDSIELCPKPVTTRVTGQAMSMGALILAAGTVREAFPNCLVMVHQGSYRVNAPFDEMTTEIAEVMRIEKLCNDYLDARTGHPSGYWASRPSGKNLYLNAEQALAEKLVHSILKRKS